MNHDALLNRTIIGLLIGGSFISATCHDLVMAEQARIYPLVDTGQSRCYDTRGEPMACAPEGRPLAGQDAAVETAPPSYRDNGDGTVTDLVTGLAWQQSPGEKLSWDEAIAGADAFELGGHDDWRLPSIKELYSLMDFDGETGRSAADARPFLDTAYFDFDYGDPRAGERHIDAQYWSSTAYTGTTMNWHHTVFGVNFADGRIKGYGTFDPRRRADKRMFVRYVRGNPGYGVNELVDNGDDTVSDRATGRIWQRGDHGPVDWAGALAYCDGLELGGQDDWRLPDAKELQSIVDYGRSPQASGEPAIDPVFEISAITDGGGALDYPFFWSSTTHLDGRNPGDAAVYVAFGEAEGWMAFPPHAHSRTLMDVHGAGAQRSDPKVGDASRFPYGRGPQGDVIRIANFARCVRGG